MFCHYCKYTSFDYLPSCPKCGRDWTQEKKALNLDWVIASTAEAKYKRQVNTDQPAFIFSPAHAYNFHSEHTAGDRTEKRKRSQFIEDYSSKSPEVKPETSTVTHEHSEAKHPPPEPDTAEGELDFPDLDQLLQSEERTTPQSPDQTQPAQAYHLTAPEEEQSLLQDLSDLQGHDESSPDDILDLSSLVHDPGLEQEDPDDSVKSRNNSSLEHK